MRYIRQEILIGKKGQAKLKKSKVVIVGLGAHGTRTAELLTRAGIENLILIDRDILEITNLQRQTLFNNDDIGKSKSFLAKFYLTKINPEVKIKSYATDLNYENIDLIKSNLVLDCTDNLETRFLINEYCVKNKIPWIYSSSLKTTGYIFNIIPEKACFRCIFREALNLETCETAGILNTITNAIASIQVNEAIKILLGKDYEKDLIYFNIWENKLEKIKVSKNPNCPVCNNRFEYLKGEKRTKIVKFCGSGTYQIKTKLNFNEIKNRLKKLGKIIETGYSVNFDNITLFKDGRVLIKAKDEKDAKSLFSKYIGN